MRHRFGQRSSVVAGSMALVLWTAGLVSAQPLRPDQMQRWQQQQHQQQHQQQQQQQMQQQALNRQMQQTNQMTLKLSGTVDLVTSGGIQMVASNGETWRLRLAPNAKVELRGPASEESLSVGQNVRFSAKVDIRHSKVEEKLSQLTICSVDEQHRLGAVAPGGGESSPQGNRRASTANPSGSKSTGHTPAATEETLEITGRIASLKGNKMTVTVPNAPFKSALKVELADRLTVDYDLRGTEAFSMAQRGDKIDIGGAPMADRVAQVAEVKISVVEAANGEESGKRPRRGARAKANAAEDAAEKPVEK